MKRLEQWQLDYIREHKNGVQIWGDPKPTKAAAIRSMEQEVLRVAKAANEVVYILELEQ